MSRRRRPAWARLALFASLALNLLVVGLAVGTFVGRGAEHRGAQLGDLGYGPFTFALPREDRRRIAEAAGREAGSFRENRRELRKDFEAFLAALRSDALDEAKLHELLARQQGRIAERQALGRELLLERIRAMSPEARAAFADRLDRLLRHRGPGRDSGRGRDRD